MTRRVVLICGPPGAGKTTLARSLGLQVYDADDACWPSEQAFRASIARLAAQRDAQAVVIRAGATRSARGKAALLIGATETVLLDIDEAECVRRVQARGGAQVHREVVAIREWWKRYEPDQDPTKLDQSEDW